MSEVERDHQKKADEFYLRIAQALSGCQLVEQELKLFITEALALVRKCVGDKMSFRMSGDDVENHSLGRLIETFDKLCENRALVTELQRFTKARNFLSHRGISCCINPDDELDEHAMSEVEGDLAKIRADAMRLRNAIHDEGRTIFAHLWFDDVSEQGKS